MKGECSDAASQWYCNTLFYKAFPTALNIGRSGWTIEEWTHTINNGDPLIAKLAELEYHTQIIIELGANNVHDTRRSAEDLLTLMLDLFSLLRKTFPKSKLKLLSILPRYYPEYYKGHQERITAINQAFQLYFKDHADEAEYMDVTSYFNMNGEKEANIVMFMPDHLHLSCDIGYAAFERAIKQSFPNLGK